MDDLSFVIAILYAVGFTLLGCAAREALLNQQSRKKRLAYLNYMRQLDKAMGLRH